jgi:hypothetical protein
MRALYRIALGAFIVCIWASTASADVQLTIRNGRVTLVANNATVRQILTEWARIGQTKIVNLDRIPGGPVTLQLSNVAEEEALDILLRSMSGYLAAPRAIAVANLSRYDRIMVMPTVAPPRIAAAAATPSPVFQQPGITLPPEDDQNQQVPAPSIVTPARGPIFQTFPQPGGPQPASPQPAAVGQTPEPATPNAAPGLVGTPRPGMIIQPAVQPGQTQPGQVQPGQAAPAQRPSGN